MKDDRSKDCVIIGKSYRSQSSPKNYLVLNFAKAEEDEKARGFSFGTKRLHKKTISPRTENAKSPFVQ